MPTCTHINKQTPLSRGYLTMRVKVCVCLHVFKRNLMCVCALLSLFLFEDVEIGPGFGLWQSKQSGRVVLSAADTTPPNKSVSNRPLTSCLRRHTSIDMSKKSLSLSPFYFPCHCYWSQIRMQCQARANINPRSHMRHQTHTRACARYQVSVEVFVVWKCAHTLWAKHEHDKNNSSSEQIDSCLFFPPLSRTHALGSGHIRSWICTQTRTGRHTES